jgi:hypothetical protein
MSDNFVVFMILVYNFAILAGASYLIVVYNWSMWIYLLAMLCLCQTSSRKKDD